jgi:hypothetical protein
MQHHVAILGAGPVGLDAALACAAAGRTFTVYEAGDTVAAHVRAWGHVRLFTPWDLNVSHRMRALLPHAPTGQDCPTGAELTERLLDPVAALPVLADRIRLRTRVVGVARTGLLKHEQIGSGARAAAPFTLLLDGPDGEETAEADLVLDCTGTYAVPNTLGAGGIPARGERALAHRITRTLPAVEDPEHWAGTVLLVVPGSPRRPPRVTSQRCPAPGSSAWCAAPRPTGEPCPTTRCPAAGTSSRPPGRSPAAPTATSRSTPAPRSRPSPPTGAASTSPWPPRAARGRSSAITSCR